MNFYETEVIEVKRETSDCWSVKLNIPEGFTWKAGQYNLWKFADYQVAEGDKPMRVFSIASAPEDGYLMFATRIAEKHTSWKEILKTQLKAGDKMMVAKANGTFAFNMDRDRSFALAGGIGITPIRALIKHWSENPCPDHRFTLVYTDARKEYCFEEDFKEIEKKMPNLKLVYTWEIEDTNSLLKAYSEENGNNAEYLIAGSPGMNAAITETLKGFGIEEENIKTDNFMGY